MREGSCRRSRAGAGGVAPAREIHAGREAILSRYGSRSDSPQDATINLSNGMTPGKLVVSPDGRFVYVPVGADTSAAAGAAAGVAVIDSQSHAVVTPDGARLFVVPPRPYPRVCSCPTRSLASRPRSLPRFPIRANARLNNMALFLNGRSLLIND